MVYVHWLQSLITTALTCLIAHIVYHLLYNWQISTMENEPRRNCPDDEKNNPRDDERNHPPLSERNYPPDKGNYPPPAELDHYQDFGEERESVSFLAEEGLHFNKKGKLVDTCNEPFMFDYYADPRDNQIRYENICTGAEWYVNDLLAQRLKRTPVRGDNKGTSIYVSRNYQKKEHLLVLIHGSGAVRAGQWSRRLIINDNLDSGTQLPYINRALSLGWGVLVTNTNDNSAHEGSRSPTDHGLFVWKHFVLKETAIKKIAIVAHSAGGGVTTDILNKYYEDFKKRVFAIAFTDAFGHPSYSAEKYFKKVTTNWVASRHPLGTVVSHRSHSMRCVSAGTPVHEETSHVAIDRVFNYIVDSFIEKTAGNAVAIAEQRSHEVAEQLRKRDEEDDMAIAMQRSLETERLRKREAGKAEESEVDVTPEGSGSAPDVPSGASSKDPDHVGGARTEDAGAGLNVRPEKMGDDANVHPEEMGDDANVHPEEMGDDANVHPEETGKAANAMVEQPEAGANVKHEEAAAAARFDAKHFSNGGNANTDPKMKRTRSFENVVEKDASGSRASRSEPLHSVKSKIKEKEGKAKIPKRDIDHTKVPSKRGKVKLLACFRGSERERSIKGTAPYETPRNAGEHSLRNAYDNAGASERHDRNPSQDKNLSTKQKEKKVDGHTSRTERDKKTSTKPAVKTNQYAFRNQQGRSHGGMTSNSGASASSSKKPTSQQNAESSQSSKKKKGKKSSIV